LSIEKQEEMRARKKLDETAYFLNALKRIETEAFDYNLSAFLCAWRSILDVMLFDFAEKYSLGFSPEALLTEDKFRHAAEASENKEALKFIAWWKKQLNEISKSPLYRKRNMVVHRVYPDLVYTIPIPIALSHHFQDAGEKTVFLIKTETPEGGKILMTNSPKIMADPALLKEVQVKQIGRFATEVRGPSFDDFPERAAKDVCQQAFDDMRGIVETAERDYWNRHPPAT
jgi:hypothetical protein